MDNSILEDIKALLHIAAEYDYFDRQVIMYINSAFSILYQLGVGRPFSINGYDEKWSDYPSVADMDILGCIKPYIYIRTRIAFDPPTSGFLTESYNKQMSELEWRMNIVSDPQDIDWD